MVQSLSNLKEEVWMANIWKVSDLLVLKTIMLCGTAPVSHEEGSFFLIWMQYASRCTQIGIASYNYYDDYL